MAADTPQYGVDSQGQPQPMPPDQQQPVDPSQQQVDPGSPPPDPMLAGPDAGAPLPPGEWQTRERVELEVLLTIESLAKACQAGEGAANPQFVQAFGTAGDAWGRVYTALTGAEQKQATPQSVPQPQQGFFDNTGQQAA